MENEQKLVKRVCKIICCKNGPLSNKPTFRYKTNYSAVCHCFVAFANELHSVNYVSEELI